jgi:hypothetical protein
MRRQESPAGVRRSVWPRACGLALLLLTASFLLLTWPATGRGQSSYRRDRERSRRDYSSSSSSTRPDSGRSGRSRSEADRRASTQTAPGQPNAAPPATPQAAPGRITAAAEPNVPAVPTRRIEARRPRRDVQDEQWQKYAIITQRNMFSRTRVPPRPVDDTPPPPRVMPNPESYLLLKGVVQENNQFIAFVEDKQSGNVLRLHEGDHVARGTVKSLNLDGLEYQFEDKTVAVHLGSDLEGGSGALTAGDLASFVPMAAPAGQGTPLPAADEAEILQRLMQQRQQEIGR